MRRKRYLWLIVLVVVLAVSIPLAVRREATFSTFSPNHGWTKVVRRARNRAQSSRTHSVMREQT